MPQPAERPDEAFAGRLSPANDPSVPTSELSAVPEIDVDTAAVRTPMRFGRLALWMASASALGIGVLGTVAYSMWFTHDQRVYAEAVSSARKTLGIEQPVLASASAQTQSAGAVEPAMSAANTLPVDTTRLADNAPSSDVAESASTDGANGTDVAGTAGLAAVTAAAAAKAQSGDSAQAQAVAPRKAANRANRSNSPQTYQTAQVPRRRGEHNKAEPGLFARVGAFFHRVSYQRNVPSRQREEYSRP